MKDEITIHNVLDFIAQGKYMLAQNGLKVLIAINPDEDKLYSLYHYCTQQIMETPDGDLVEAAQKKTLPPWRKCLCAAYPYANQGEYAHAIELLKQAQKKLVTQNEPLPSYPEQPLERKTRVMFQNQALLLLHQAKCFYLAGDKIAAKDTYKKCLQSRFQGAKLSIRDSVEIFLQLKDPQAAWEYLQQVDRQADPEYLFPFEELHSKIYLVLGQAEEAQKAQHQARSYYEKGIQRFPLDEFSYETFCHFLINIGSYQHALTMNAKAIALSPTCYEYYLTRACIYAHLQDKVQAFECLSKAKQIAGSTIQQYVALERGKIYELLGEYAEAERQYQKAEERPEARRDCLVALYRKMGQPEKIKQIDDELRQCTEFDERVSEQMLAELLD